MQKIIFKNPDNTIGIIYPTAEGYALGMQALGEKDTPTGLPFWIVEDTVIPSDRTNRDSWELDGTEGDPDGYGD
jgi:hypothetical protein